MLTVSSEALPHPVKIPPVKTTAAKSPKILILLFFMFFSLFLSYEWIVRSLFQKKRRNIVQCRLSLLN